MSDLDFTMLLTFEKTYIFIVLGSIWAIDDMVKSKTQFSKNGQNF